MAGRSYFTLMASLPALPPHFEVERDPITRPRLDERLKMLEPSDAAVFEKLDSFLAWDRQPIDQTDEQVVNRYDLLGRTVSNRLLRDLIDDRMEVRTIVGGLRRRKAGLPPPVGIDPWAAHIRRNWEHPEFGLGGRHQWIARFRESDESGRVLDAQRVLLSVAWDAWSREAGRHHFTFEAVILYVARWDVIDRWTTCDAARGRERFEQLISQTLGDHGKLHD